MKIWIQEISLIRTWAPEILDSETLYMRPKRIEGKVPRILGTRASRLKSSANLGTVDQALDQIQGAISRPKSSQLTEQ